MKNLFNKADMQSTVNRINGFSPYSESLWGQMDVHQVILHLKDQLDIALGNLTAAAQGPFIFRTRPARFLILYIIPWRKSKEVTPKEMDAKLKGAVITDFESDKHLLLVRLKEFGGSNEFAPHPFFGSLSKRYWGRLAWKHINHHLVQFGC